MKHISQWEHQGWNAQGREHAEHREHRACQFWKRQRWKEQKYHGWEHQAGCIQQALRDTNPIDLEHLLIPRDRNGLLTRQMTPPPGAVPRTAAVLIALYPHQDELWLPLTVRSSNLVRHGGEVSLPGGATDPEDDGPIATALRETHEELGIHPSEVEVWGHLSPTYISASNFYLTPIVGFLPSQPHFCPCEMEIAEVFCVPLSQLLDPATVFVETRILDDGNHAHIPYFALHGKVWGATALILSELLARMSRI